LDKESRIGVYPVSEDAVVVIRKERKLFDPYILTLNKDKVSTSVANPSFVKKPLPNMGVVITLIFNMGVYTTDPLDKDIFMMYGGVDPV